MKESIKKVLEKTKSEKAKETPMTTKKECIDEIKQIMDTKFAMLLQLDVK